MTQLGAAGGPEVDLIRALAARWGDVAVGLGDDAAVFQPPRGDRIVASTDSAVERVHFRREWLSLPEIGFRAATAALSDLAAMAATPVGILVAFTTTFDRRRELLDVAEGIGDAVRAARTRILGGNISAGPALTITTTVIGSAFAPLTRAGARAGDAIFVTGRLGGPAAALRALGQGTPAAASHRARFAAPAARIGEALWLAARGATAAIDVSDGLARDADHLAAASNVRVTVELERVPVLEGAAIEDALAGGEEYELLVAAPPDLDCAAFAATFGIPVTQIGSVAAPGDAAGVVFTRGGRRVATPGGYDHFSA